MITSRSLLIGVSTLSSISLSQIASSEAMVVCDSPDAINTLLVEKANENIIYFVIFCHVRMEWFF